MRFMVPHKRRCNRTGRIQQIRLAADTCPEELMLTHLERAMQSGRLRRISLVLDDGTTIHQHFTPPVGAIGE